MTNQIWLAGLGAFAEAKEQGGDGLDRFASQQPQNDVSLARRAPALDRFAPRCLGVARWHNSVCFRIFHRTPSGFIGKRLVRRLLSRPDSVVYFLTLDASEAAVESLHEFWDAGPMRASPIAGDLTQPRMGIDDATR